MLKDPSTCTPATLVKTDGPYLEAVLEVGGTHVTVMDELVNVSPGDRFVAALSILEARPALAWDTGNFGPPPDKQTFLEQLRGTWDYSAGGQILRIQPTIIDVGPFKLDLGDELTDTRAVGSFATFGIARLGAAVVSREASE